MRPNDLLPLSPKLKCPVIPKLHWRLSPIRVLVAYQLSTHFGIHKDIYCVGKDNTIAFLQDVLLEIMALFPSNIIHIGEMKHQKIGGINVRTVKNESKRSNFVMARPFKPLLPTKSHSF